jgi:hypothetical protein
MPFSDAVVPGRALDFLVSTMAVHTAAETIKEWKPGSRIHLGDPFGVVLVWLWQYDRRHAGIFFADLVAQIRKWDENATRAITLDALLEGLPLALQGLKPEQQDELIRWLRQEVPNYYGRSLNDLNSTD